MTPARATVTRHWPTGVVIDDVDLTGIVDDRLISDLHADGVPFERLPPSTGPTSCTVHPLRRQ